ncbi:MAG: right-handed parallel beta-helix repeat-containing protein [Phycisphaeraceae bacterium]|nr:right-handed parallel beta-helix repeat-containing protein [Phycisphaeraceae bacterium]MCB9847819.1 right-handed parallel beta-helix repeat-containing protein [Phycisphaeraceae bacterium]
MRSRTRAVNCLVCVLALAPASMLPAGELDPPAGAVAPTMKDLDDVSPRRILRNDFDTLTPIVIDAPGSYYLGEDILALPSQHGIEIRNRDVTIDLNGFRVLGNTEVGSLDGIVATVASSNIVIRNGSVIAFTDAIDLGSAVECRVENVSVGFPTAQGIRAGARSVVADCRVTNPGSAGIIVDDEGVVERCLVSESGLAGYSSNGAVVFRDCVSTGGNSQGFLPAPLSRLERCTAIEPAAEGFFLSSDSAAIACVAQSAGAEGFQVGTDNVLESCVSENSSTDGFYAQFGQAQFLSCVAVDSAGVGFNVGVDCVLTDCQARENTGEGFLGDSRTQLIGCVATGNGPSGIRLFGNDGLIRGCTACNNTGFGINVGGTGNGVVGNVTTSNDAYNIAPGNPAGTIHGTPSNAGPWDNLEL